jgi:hypothetical protein
MWTNFWCSGILPELTKDRRLLTGWLQKPNIRLTAQSKRLMQSPERRVGEVKLPRRGNCWISAVDPKATLRGRARSELAAVLGAVTADALTLEGPIGSFSLTSIATQSHLGRLGRSPTSIYLAFVGRRRGARPAGAYRAIAPDFGERSNEPIDLLIGM